MTLFRLWRVMRRRGSDAAILREEMAAHLRALEEEYRSRGLSAEAAETAARRQFGNLTNVQENVRDVFSFGLIERLAQDIRYAARTLRASPGFTATVIGTIAVGLGLNAALFTIFNAYVLKPLMIRDPSSVYSFTWNDRAGRGHAFSWFEFNSLRTSNPALSEVAASRFLRAPVNGRPMLGELVTGNYFHMLGVNAALGRTLGPEDSVVPGREPVVVLSYAAWQTKFGGDSDIVGKTIMVRATSLEVIGVTTQGFGGLGETPGEYWVPLTLSRQLEPGPDLFGPEQPERLNIVGRLGHGVSSTQALTALAGWSKQMTADRPDSERAVGVTLESQATAVPFSAELLAAFSPIVAAFALVLLAACANVANMLLARALARRREIGVRLALGAARHRIIGQLLTEGFLLAIAAGVAGFAISQWTIQLAVAVMFDTLPGDMAARVTIVPLLPDTRVFAFTLIAALVSAVVFGLAPAIQATRADLLLATKGEFTTDIRPMRLRNSLVVAQITISVMLLICSGVLLRGAAAMGRSDVGFKTEGVVVVGVEAKDRRNAFEGMAAEPAVEAIAAAGSTPLNGLLPIVSMSLQASEKVLRASYNHVSPEYFAVLDIPILKGRNFTPEEARARDTVAIISDATARRLLPARDVVGQEIRIYGDARSNWGEQMPSVLTVRVIGVARDIVSCCLLYGKDAALIYFPVTAAEAKGSLLLRVRGDAAAATNSLDKNLTRLVPGGVEELHPLSDGLALSTYPFRAASWISASLGALALLLAVSGIHGVLAYWITQRSKELAIRVALGGTTRAVAGLVLKQSMRLVIIGIGVGAALALGLSGLLAAQLIHVNAFDVVAYGGGMTLVSVAALAATYFPARRAARIDPMAVLRRD